MNLLRWDTRGKIVMATDRLHARVRFLDGTTGERVRPDLVLPDSGITPMASIEDISDVYLDTQAGRLVVAQTTGEVSVFAWP